MTLVSALHLGDSIQFPKEHVKKEDHIATPTVSTSTLNAQKVEEIFNARASIRSKIRTDNKIKTFVTVTLTLIGIGAIIAGCVLGAGLPFAAAAGIVIGGHVVGLIGAFFIPTKRILKDEEEKQFWSSVSANSLSDLTSKRWNWYCVGAPYYGAVEGVCKISYTELQDHGLMNHKSARKLQTLLDGNKQLECSEAQEIYDLKKISSDLLVTASREKITAKYIEPKIKLQSEFEAFRNEFIHETHQRLCNR